MGKNYVENSLKRFLKRKVKITMGVVVSFLITGAVAFAEGTAETVKDLEYLLLKNTQENNFCPGVCPEGVKFNPEGEILELKKNGTEDKRLKINSEIYHNHGTIIGGNDTWNKIQLHGNNPIFYNYGEIIFNNAKGIQISDDATNAVVYNYGSIESKSNYILNANMASNFYNYGKLKLKADDEQPLGFFSANKNTMIYNYGSMIALSRNYTGSSAQINLFFGKESYKFFNNGYINVDSIEMDLPKEEKLFNNSVILVKKFKNIGLGSISGKPPVPATENSIKNKGIFIVGENISDTEWKAFNDNQGAVLQKQDDGTYKLLNSDTQTNEIIKAHGVVKDMSDKTEINSSNTADNMFINNKSLTLNLGDKVTGKTITAVSQTERNVVLDNDTDGDNVSGKNSLTLNNTAIIGYFEKDGTLLKVDGALTLEKGSLINAMVARDENGNILKDAQNVVAVDVYGKLTYDNTSHIYGTIKGGKESQITLNGSETVNNKLNANELNEVFSTSGTINLDKGNWTKGTGSIALKETGKVNINGGKGNLAGYIHNTSIGDIKAVENKVETTLDGMITGKGTLNVNKIKFELGNLEIDSLNDTFTIEGNKEITIEGTTTQEDILNKIELSGVFNKKIENGNLVLSLKSAEEIGIYDPAKQKQYEELIKNFKNENFYELVNTGNIEAIKKQLNVLDKVIELLGTAGVKITRDLTGAFTDAVVEFDKKANKGEWLTNAKYIGSDMEYDGTKHINGYDSDIKSMIGMAEYGITENTSLGFALGGGDTEVDLKTLNGKSTSFDGKNYYAGIYAKHSMNGFDMIGSLGYTISDLDVEKGGSADSEAITLAGYIKKDVYVTDTVKLEPNLSFTYDYIMQDKAEMGEGMTIDSGDSHVFEAGAGLNLVKEFALEKGSLKLKTGVKYSMTNIERNKDVTGKFYNADVNLGNPDIDDKEGKAHVGFDYEHETGFGVNGKYEMMWSDSGDDSRITAGISYRF